MEHNITPEIITDLSPREFLVVGVECGKSILSLDKRIVVLYKKYPSQVHCLYFTWDEHEIVSLIDQFLFLAKTRKNHLFYVLSFSGVSIGIIAPLLEQANHCSNVYLPRSYWTIIDKVIRKRRYSYNEAISLPCRPVISSKSLISSNSASYLIKLVPQAYGLVLESGKGNRFQGMCVVVKNGEGKIVVNDYINGVPPYYWDSRKLSDGHFSLEIYFKEFLADSYCLYIQSNIKNKEGFCSFIPSSETQHNEDLVQSIGVDSQTLSQYLRITSVVPGALTEFRELAFRITNYSSGDYDKVLAIHDWIAKNIHYDYDSLIDSLYLNTPIEQSAILALRTRKCVCQGYTDLSIVLLRTIGIPAVGVYCRTEEDSTSEPSKDEANHIFTFAYCDNRWILMDITWDSRNRFESGEFKKGEQISHLYFDSTIQFLSGTHRMLGISA